MLDHSADVRAGGTSRLPPGTWKLKCPHEEFALGIPAFHALLTLRDLHPRKLRPSLDHGKGSGGTGGAGKPARASDTGRAKRTQHSRLLRLRPPTRH